MHDRAGHADHDIGTSTLGRTLRARRDALRLTQEELAELAGCSTRFVHSLEAGKPTVRLDKLLTVLDVLGLGLAVVPGHGDVIADDGVKPSVAPAGHSPR